MGFAKSFPEAVKKELAGKHGFKEFCHDFYSKAMSEAKSTSDEEPNEDKKAKEGKTASEKPADKDGEKPSKESKDGKKPLQEPKEEKSTATESKVSEKPDGTSTSPAPSESKAEEKYPVYAAPEVDLGPGCKDCRKPSLLDSLWDWLMGNPPASAARPEPMKEPAQENAKDM